MRIEGINVGAIRAAVGEGWEKVATERLGPAIREDAKRFCPVDTGSLRESIEDSFDEESGTLYVSATGGDDGRVYAAYQRRAWAPRVSPVYGHHRTHQGRPRAVPTS